MKECKCCKVLKDPSEFIKDKTREDGLYVYCKTCNKERRKLFRENNKDRLSESKKKYYSINKESISIRKKEAYSLNKTSESFLINKRSKNSNWKKLNKHLVNKETARRRANRLKATPPSWGDNELNIFVIQEAYHLASIRESLTGIKWHVDHIVPLVNSKVCGLHVYNNLRVITAVSNLSKGNSFII